MHECTNARTKKGYKAIYPASQPASQSMPSSQPANQCQPASQPMPPASQPPNQCLPQPSHPINAFQPASQSMPLIGRYQRVSVTFSLGPWAALIWLFQNSQR
ncbi:hypothetical protein EOC06_32735 [Mesorhizobium sp. M7A.F.Ca.MR.362.00.0.0]|nr:hypothetical protein EOC06_32735 [Mesorhizobium sp. M7A.F.Ca.MR.362.00.0.0]